MSVLDAPATYSRLDPAGMGEHIAHLPQQCRDAWQRAQALKLPAGYRGVKRIVVLGMGGSAIGGELLAAQGGSAPVFVHRGYDLPAFVDGETLVIAASYSGNTEETLSGFQRALSLPAKTLVVTTGGRLLAMAQQAGVPAFVFDYPAQPRAALGYGFIPLLAIAAQVGALPDMGEAVAEAAAVMEGLIGAIGRQVATEHNPAKRLALRLAGKIPVIYGAQHLTPVAHRWKTQFNENSEVWSFYEELPEANHNAIVGYGLPKEALEQLLVIFLCSASLHPRVLLRYEATQQALAEAGVATATVEVLGVSPLAQMLYGVLYGDYVSYYLALLNGRDPTPVPPIQALKERLARQPD